MKKIIIKADDYGFTEAVSLGILLAHKNGIVKNTGMMVNMPAAIQAAEWIRSYPELCLGLHINLIVGTPCCDLTEIPSLIDKNGKFISSKVRRAEIAQGIDPFILSETKKECVAQVIRFIELNNRIPEYIEAHAVSSPTIQKAIAEVANEFGIEILPHHQPSKWSVPQFKSDHYEFYKELLPYSEYFENRLDLTSNLILFVLHPGFVDEELIRNSSLTLDRTKDYEMMIDPDVKAVLLSKGFQIISFREIK